MVSRLPDIIPPPAPGPLEAVQEIPSVTNYYDGSLNLNVGVVECHTIAMPGDCVKQSICGKLLKIIKNNGDFFLLLFKGWCGQSSSCIRGTQLAPNEICDRQSYVFNPPSKKW